MRQTILPVLLGLAVLTVPIGSWAVDQVAIEQHRAINDLIGKDFHVTTTNGKRSLTVLPPDQGKTLAFKGYEKPCNDNVARLNVSPGRDAAAVIIEDTPLALAFLDCPASNDGGAGSIVALFDYRNTNVPQCHTFIDLMDKSEYYWWGMVDSVELQKISDNEYFVAVTLSGGDAGDAWTSYAFLHMNNQCQITPLAKFYASTHIDIDVPDEKECDGNTISYRFISESTVEIETKKLVCNGKWDNEPVDTKKYDLNAMFRDPKLRIFEPR